MSDNHSHIKNDPRWKAARVECFERDDYTCVSCGSTENLEADHIVPLDVLFADGVTPDAIDAAVDPDGLATRCKPCNGSKGARTDVVVVRNTWVNPRYMSTLSWLEAG